MRDIEICECGKQPAATIHIDNNEWMGVYAHFLKTNFHLSAIVQLAAVIQHSERFFFIHSSHVNQLISCNLKWQPIILKRSSFDCDSKNFFYKSIRFFFYLSICLCGEEEKMLCWRKKWSEWIFESSVNNKYLGFAHKYWMFCLLVLMLLFDLCDKTTLHLL